MGDSLGTTLSLVIVLTAAITLAAAELFYANAILDGWTRAASSTPTSIVGRASVTGGDTLKIRNHRIRLHGIDAPESRQTCRDTAGRGYRCGQKVALALSDKIGQRTVSCKERDGNRYGRSVAVCFVGGIDLSGRLVQQGWTVAYMRYSRDNVAGAPDASRYSERVQRARLRPPLPDSMDN